MIPNPHPVRKVYVNYLEVFLFVPIQEGSAIYHIAVRGHGCCYKQMIKYSPTISSSLTLNVRVGAEVQKHILADIAHTGHGCSVAGHVQKAHNSTSDHSRCVEGKLCAGAVHGRVVTWEGFLEK